LVLKINHNKEFYIMKKTILATVLALSMVAGTAIAQQNMNMGMEGQGMQQGQGMMMGRGMGQGMMGGGMGQGMMGGHGMMGGGMGKGMMMQGHMGCMNMMGRGMGMGMMGGGMMGNMTADNQKEFMDDTKEIREKMHMMRFEYMEAMRNPKTTLEDIGNMEQDMLDIRKNMMKKAEKYQDKK
jgi:hypothetical protein